MATIEELMTKLKCTRAEAEQIKADDLRIDKGEKLFEQTADQKQASKKARGVGRAVGVYQFSTRERKADFDKSELISLLVNGINEHSTADNFEIINPEREFLFTYNGKKYKVVLSAPRK